MSTEEESLNPNSSYPTGYTYSQGKFYKIAQNYKNQPIQTKTQNHTERLNIIVSN